MSIALACCVSMRTFSVLIPRRRSQESKGERPTPVPKEVLVWRIVVDISGFYGLLIMKYSLSPIPGRC